MGNNQRKTILLLSVIIVSLIVVTSSISTLTPSFYFKETLNWQAQSIGQDYINLMIAAFLLLSAFLIYIKNPFGGFLWAGTIIYLLYTYLIYCFDIHFNILFLEYCTVLGLSFYSLFYFFYSRKEEPLKISNHRITKFTAIYFIVISVLFYCLWLLEIIPPLLRNAIPKSLNEVGLFTNPIHVIDLALFLPGVFMVAILLLRKKNLGYIFAPIILTFFILMDITIATLTLVMQHMGIKTTMVVMPVMIVLAIFSMILLILYLRNIKLTN